MTVTQISSLIDGTSVPGDAGTLVSTNPAQLDDVVAEISLASVDQVVEAFRVATAAQRGWAETPAPVRGRVIAQVGRLVESNQEALAALIVREVGKPRAEALGEVQEIIDTCDFFLGEGRRLYGQTVPSEMRDKQLFTFRVPVGVAGIITAGNFPVAVPSWYLVPALLCGNAVVWKPAEYAAALGDALTKLFIAG
ncbi:MAG: alpha-ketoglutaric semialdehyde dehydrogenase, partial [Frankiales bacterium]|nr:alpha-ketoglutaric semialdehyde dehydrogenase [Frankiales bacterium]